MLRVPENYEIRNPVLRRVVNEAKEEGRAEARDASLTQIRSVLYARANARGLVLSTSHRAVIADCRDEATLADWVARVAAGENPSEIFRVMAEPSHH